MRTRRGPDSSDAGIGTIGSALAPVMEVFASIQGEGAYVGEPQVFLRLFGCSLRCTWCDTPNSWSVPAAPRARIAGLPGREDGWMRPFEAATHVSRLDPQGLRSVSVTGGEPLLWPAFVSELRSLLGGRRLHLETAGAHPRTLASLMNAVDHVSLDLKPFADLDAPEWSPEALPPAARPTSESTPRTREEWAEVRALCLDLVRSADACAKIVIAANQERAEITTLLDDVAAMAPELTVILQPVTPVGGIEAPRPREIEALVDAAVQRRLRVRVVPQVHRALRLP